MNQIDKTLAKLPGAERDFYADLLKRVERGALEGLRAKKVKGTDCFRIRVGNWRIVFRRRADSNEVVRFQRRNESTYRDL